MASFVQPRIEIREVGERAFGVVMGVGAVGVGGADERREISGYGSIFGGVPGALAKSGSTSSVGVPL